MNTTTDVTRIPAPRQESTPPQVPQTDQNTQPTPEPEDSVSFPRKALETITGIAGGAISTVAHIVPGGIAGGFQGVASADENTPPDDAVGAGEGIIAALTTGAAAGTLAAVLGLGVVPAIVAGIAGLAYIGLQAASGGAEKIGKPLAEKVHKAVEDNTPTGKKARDVSKNFTEGALVGSAAATKAAWGVGQEQGAGLAGGVVEGLKGSVKTLTGAYNAPEQPDAKKDEESSLTGKILRLPKEVLRNLVGLAGGVAGAAYSTADGAVQGFFEGAAKEYSGSPGLHRAIVGTEVGLTALAAGIALMGGWGALAGGAAGVGLGLLVSRIERKGGADKAITGGVARSVQGAASDNSEKPGDIYKLNRNAVEGLMVGATAGAKYGWKSGFEGGRGVVDGVIEGISGLFSGISDSTKKAENQA
ncbi:MAG: hypothetical protein HYU64_19010 [Armatimonadetes bacterium]|nr:hypothetical protein [Armatimonadota bacterium]